MAKRSQIFGGDAERVLITLRGALLFLLGFSLALTALSSASADGLPSRTVFLAGETEPFAADAEILELYAAPLLKADCLLLGAGGGWMLVDMGYESDYPVIRGLLQSLGVERIDIAFNTHPHWDHIGGMAQLAEDVPVGRFITAFPLDYTGSSVLQRETISALEKAGIPVERMDDGSAFALGGADIRVMRVDSPDTNAASALLHIRFGQRNILLAADARGPSQAELARRDGLKADVLKYPHHGLEKLNEAFTRAVNPEFAFFTNGPFLTREGQNWLEEQQIAYLFAARGLIRVQTDGQKIIVSQELAGDVLKNR